MMQMLKRCRKQKPKMTNSDAKSLLSKLQPLSQSLTHQQKIEKLRELQSKMNKGIPLTAKEENLVMDWAADQEMKPRNEVVVEDGVVYDTTSVEVDGIFEGAKALKEIHDNAPNPDKKYLGSIDMVTARIWAKECGAKIFSKEWRAYARKKIQSGDYALYFPKSSRKVLH